MKLPFILLRRRQWQSALDDIARQKCELNDLHKSVLQLQDLLANVVKRIDETASEQRSMNRKIKTLTNRKEG